MGFPLALLGPAEGRNFFGNAFEIILLNPVLGSLGLPPPGGGGGLRMGGSCPDPPPLPSSKKKPGCVPQATTNKGNYATSIFQEDYFDLFETEPPPVGQN